MKTQDDTNRGGYSIGQVREAPGRNEFFVTLTRDGAVVREVRVRAPASAPSYVDDVPQPRPLTPAARGAA